MKKKIVALLLALVMLVGIIPAAVFAADGDPKVVLTVTPDKTVAVAGDEITFTVKMASELVLSSMAFRTAFPEGFTYVDKSGVIDSGAKAALGFDAVDWTEWSDRIGAEQGDNYVNGYLGIAPVAPGAEGVTICTFKVTVDDDAALGEYVMDLTGLDEFCYTLDWIDIEPEEILVDSTPVTVTDHICSADKLTAVAAKDATCTEDGNVAYYVCECGTKYVDEAMSEVIADVIVPASGHKEAEAVKENEVAAGCETAGSYDSVVYCATCGEKLSSETITEDAKGHKEAEAVKENIVPQTCTTNGSYDSVVYCSVCDEELSRENVVIPAGDGHTEAEAVVEDKVEATCTATGSYNSVVYCSACGEKLSTTPVEIPAKGHSYEAVVTAPTCTDAGYTTYTCADCGDDYVEDLVNPLGHTPDKVVIVDATATREGSKKTYCSVCDELLKTEALPKVEGKVVLTVANGTNTILSGIVNSDYSASVSVPKGAIIDTSSITAAIAMKDVASLGVSGTKTYEKVITTGVNKTVELDKYLPKFSNATVSGMIDGVAYGYDFTGTDTAEELRIDAAPQDVEAVRAAWAALTSHMTAGEKAADDSYVVIPGAAYIQIGTEKLVFEDENAELKLDNIVSGSGITADIRAAVKLLNVEELEDAQIEIFLPAGTVLAISNSQVTLDDDATITAYGYKDSDKVNTIMSQLRDCETTEAIILTAVRFISDAADAINGQDVVVDIEFDHIPEADWTVVEEATCTEDGKKVKYCIMCGEVAVEEAIPAISHEYETVVTDPTCEDKGYTTYTCTVCGDTYASDYVEALGHDYSSVVTAPTCTEDGYRTCTCSICGDSHSTTDKPALGHTEGEVVKENIVDATCTAAGSYDAVVYCTVCGAEISRVVTEIPAKGHSYEAVVTAPTCTEGGFTTYTCSACGDSYVADETEALGHSSLEDADWKEDSEVKGKYNAYCSACGTYLASETRFYPATGIELDKDFVETKYIRKAVAFTLTETVLPADKDKLGYDVIWTSSNEKVATVDQDGNVTTHHRGNAVITATLVDADGKEIAKDTCEVKVYYTFCQWLIWLFLLGCCWYFV